MGPRCEDAHGDILEAAPPRGVQAVLGDPRTGTASGDLHGKPHADVGGRTSCHVHRGRGTPGARLRRATMTVGVPGMGGSKELRGSRWLPRGCQSWWCSAPRDSYSGTSPGRDAASWSSDDRTPGSAGRPRPEPPHRCRIPGADRQPDLAGSAAGGGRDRTDDAAAVRRRCAGRVARPPTDDGAAGARGHARSPTSAVNRRP